MNAVTASRPHDQLPPPSVGDLFAHPQYWISGAGHDAARAAECPHGYRLTASCLCCYQDEDPQEYQFTTVELFGLRVMSTRQPWGTSLLERGKPVENRTRATSWRGPVVIHSGRKWDDRGRDIAAEMRVPAVPRDAPTGYLGVMDLVGVHHDNGCCRPWGEPGSYHWEFENPRVFHAPLAGPGMLGMYRKVPLAVAHAVVAEAWTRGGLTRPANPSDRAAAEVPESSVAGHLAAVAGLLTDEADSRPRPHGRAAWREAATRVARHAEQAARVDAGGGPGASFVTHLDWVRTALDNELRNTGDADSAAEIAAVRERLHAYHEGDNYRVTLLCADEQRTEVVVRATDRFEAAKRAMDADPRHLVGATRSSEAPIDVCSVALLTPNGPRT